MMSISPVTRIAPLYLATAIALSACGGGGGSASTATSTTTTGTTPASSTPALNASNASQVGITSYRLASDVFDAATAASNELKSVSPSGGGTGLNLLGIALERMPARLVWSGEARLTKSVVVGNAALNSTEQCDSGRVVSTYDDVNSNGVVDAGETGSVRFENCVLVGVRFTGSFTLLVNAISSTGTVDSADVTFTFVDFTSTDLIANQTASAKGDLRISTTLTYATATATVPTSVRATFSGAQLVSTLQGDARTLSNYSGSLSVTPASNDYAFQLTGSASSSKLPGALSLSMPTAFEGTYAGEVRAGVLVAKAADGSLLRMAVAPPTGVKVEIDTNGDGTAEATSTVTWAQLTAS